jgi:hypothetical protein
MSGHVLAAGRVDAGVESLRGDEQRDLGRVSSAIAVCIQVSVVAGGGSLSQGFECGIVRALRRV